MAANRKVFPPHASFVFRDKASDRYLLTPEAVRYLRDETNNVTGTYTPKLYNVTNVTASTTYECHYFRVSDVVHVAGRFDIDVTAGSVPTELGISFPIPTDMPSTFMCAGTGVAPLTAGIYGGIYGDTTNNRAIFACIPSTLTNSAVFFTFTYRVIQ